MINEFFVVAETIPECFGITMEQAEKIIATSKIAHDDAVVDAVHNKKPIGQAGIIKSALATCENEQQEAFAIYHLGARLFVLARKVEDLNDAQGNIFISNFILF